jgi:hypothetical protein
MTESIRIDKQPGVGDALVLLIGEPEVNLAEIGCLAVAPISVCFPLRGHHEAEVRGIAHDPSSVGEVWIGKYEKCMQACEGADQTDPVHEQENRIEDLAVDRAEISGPGVVDPAFAHHLDRFGGDVERRHLVPPSLQLEGVPPGAGAEIEHSAPTQRQGPDLELRELLVIGSIKLLHRCHLVLPQGGVDHDLGVRGAVVVIEKGATQRAPACSLLRRSDQGYGQGSVRRSVGAITRIAGNNPTVSSQ